MTPHPPRHPACTLLMLAACCPWALLLPACSSSEGAGAAKASDPDAPITLDKAATDLDEMFALAKRPKGARERDDLARGEPAPRARPRASKAPPPRTVEARADEQPLAPEASITGPATPPKPPTEPATAPPTPAERQRALVGELLEVLKEQGQEEDQRARATALIALLSSMDPDAAQDAFSSLRTSLPPAQQDMLAVLESLARDLPGAAERDPGEVARLVDRVAAVLAAQHAELDIPRMELCSRVESFGRFTPLPSRAFRAGQSHAMLIYTELANFASEPQGQGALRAEVLASPAAPPSQVVSDTDEQWVTDIAQSLTIYRGRTQVYHVPEQRVRDVARTPRRDYYLVQRVTLPSTLGVGEYTIKVTTRDLQRTGSAVERTLAITIEAR